MKAVIQIAVVIERQGDQSGNGIARSQAKFHIDTDVFFAENQVAHLVKCVIPLITSAAMDFDEENAPAAKNPNNRGSDSLHGPAQADKP